MKIAITGALGHIGSALLHNLEDDDDILAIDNMSSNHHAVLFKIYHFRRGIRFSQSDIFDAGLPDLLADREIVIHLAAITDAAHSYANPLEVERVNFSGTVRIGMICAKAGVRMLFPSSTSVYGMNVGNVDEKSVVNPQSPYAWSKLNAERALLLIPDLKASILRLGTIYGLSLGARFHTAVNQFAWNAAVGKPLEVWSSAWDQRRPYLWIGDALSAMRHVIDHDLFNGQIYNVLTANHSVREVVEEIRKYRPNLMVNVVNSPIMNQYSYETFCNKFRATGWTPAGNLEMSIAQEMEWLSWVNG